MKRGASHFESRLDLAKSSLQRSTPEMLLYHGSRFDIEGDHLEPHPSRAVDGEAKVFATPSRVFALQYVGRKWTDSDFESGSHHDGENLFMIEKREGAFHNTYSGQQGWLYTVNPDTFHRDPRLSRLERVSEVPVQIESREFIIDAAQALLEADLKVVSYEDLNLIKLLKRGRKKFGAVELEKIIQANVPSTTIYAGVIDYADLNNFLFGSKNDSRKIKQIGYAVEDSQDYFAVW